MKNINRKLLANERGSAILLVLGILSLALILGMAFAFTARTDRQIAQVSADTVKVRLLSESALERILATMQHYFAGGGNPLPYPAATPIPNFDISAQQISTNGDVGYLQHYLTIGNDVSDPAETHNSFKEILFNNFALLKHIDNELSDAGAPAAAFSITNTNAGFLTFLDGVKVIGRIGYLLLEEGGKFDINECLSLKKGANSPFVIKDEFRLNGDFSGYGVSDFIYNLGNLTSLGATEWTESNTVRQGLQLQEFQVDNKFRSNLPENTNTRLQWFSYQHLYDVLGSAEFTDADFLKYSFFSAEEPEAWWHPTDKKEYHRFDLSGYEWRASGAADYYDGNFAVIPANTGWTLADRDTLVTSLSANTKTEFAAATYTSNIPYLSQMVDRNGNNVSKHVAANLVDYCDENDFVTTDFDLDWDPTPPKPPNPAPPNYCGLEKAAAISEVGLEVVIERTDLFMVSPGYNYKVKIQPSVDFVNIFSENVSIPIGQGRLLIQGTLEIVNNTNPTDAADPFPFDSAKFSVADQGDMAATDIYTDEIPFVLDASVLDKSATPYYLLRDHDFAAIAPGDVAPELEFTLKISKVVVQMEKTPDTEIYDVAYCEQNFDIVMEFPGRDTGDLNFYFYASMEAEDPRCNHRSEFWKWTDLGTTKFDMGAPPAALSALLGKDGTDYDQETSIKFSTGYIRNAPPKSFWELGAIHRGEPMRTINLKKFTAPESSTGTYLEGDAAILDQVKMGPLKYSRGKYNPNARNTQAVLDLLPAIEDGGEGSYEVTAAAGSPLPMPAVLTWTSDPSPYRGQFAEVVKGNDDTYADDRQAEAAIGCTANLLSTRHDPYTLVIVAQTMKELRKPDGNALDDDTAFDNIKSSLVCPTKYWVSGTPRYCDILGTQLYLAHIIRNAWTNEFRVIQGQYLDE